MKLHIPHTLKWYKTWWWLDRSTFLKRKKKTIRLSARFSGGKKKKEVMSSVPMSESQRISTGSRSLESPAPGTNFSAPRRDRQPVAHSNFGAYQTHPMLCSKCNYPMHHQDICVRCKMKHSCRSPLEKYYFFIADKKTGMGVFIPAVQKILHLEGFTPEEWQKSTCLS